MATSSPPSLAKQSQRTRRSKNKGKNMYSPPPFHPGYPGYGHPDFDARPDVRRALFPENMPPLEPWFRERDSQAPFQRGNPSQFLDDSQLFRRSHGFPEEPEPQYPRRNCNRDMYLNQDRRSFEDASSLLPWNREHVIANQREFGPYGRTEDFSLRETNINSAHTRNSEFSKGPYPFRASRIDSDPRVNPQPVHELARMLERQRLHDYPSEFNGVHNRPPAGGMFSPERLSNYPDWSPNKQPYDRRQSPSPRSVYDFHDAGRNPGSGHMVSPNFVDRSWCSADSPPQVRASVNLRAGPDCSVQSSKTPTKSLGELLPSQEELEFFISGCGK